MAAVAGIVTALRKRRRARAERERKKMERAEAEYWFNIYDRNSDGILCFEELKCFLQHLDASFLPTPETINWLTSSEPVTLSRLIPVIQKFRLLMIKQSYLIRLINNEKVDREHILRSRVPFIMNAFAISLGAVLDKADEDFVNGVLADFADDNDQEQMISVTSFHLLIALINWYQCLHDTLLSTVHDPDTERNTLSSCLSSDGDDRAKSEEDSEATTDEDDASSCGDSDINEMTEDASPTPKEDGSGSFCSSY